MREVNTSKDTKLNIHATSMTCLLYEREFDGADIVTDISSMGETLKFGIMRRALWAMAKTAAPSVIPPYSAWMNANADLDYKETSWMKGVMEEANREFFRSTAEASEVKAG